MKRKFFATLTALLILTAVPQTENNAPDYESIRPAYILDYESY